MRRGTWTVGRALASNANVAQVQEMQTEYHDECIGLGSVSECVASNEPDRIRFSPFYLMCIHCNSSRI